MKDENITDEECEDLELLMSQVKVQTINLRKNNIGNSLKKGNKEHKQEYAEAFLVTTKNREEERTESLDSQEEEGQDIKDNETHNKNRNDRKPLIISLHGGPHDYTAKSWF